MGMRGWFIPIIAGILWLTAFGLSGTLTEFGGSIHLIVSVTVAVLMLGLFLLSTVIRLLRTNRGSFIPEKGARSAWWDPP